MKGLSNLAIVAITRGGAALAARLGQAFPEADLWVAERFAGEAAFDASEGRRRTIPFTGSPGWIVPALFADYRGIIFLFSMGVVVRILAPHLRGKHVDPAVVVVDQGGHFAVAVLSGHLGGANELAQRVADAIGAQAVITTASDVQGTIAVDLFGREHGWRIDDRSWEHVTAVSAALVNGEPVALYQEAGELNWWPANRPLPANLRTVAELAEGAGAAAALVISDRTDVFKTLPCPTVVYRPRSLAVGVGCNRGTPAGEIAAAVATTLEDGGLSPLAVRNWASIEAKADEVGLLAAAKEAGVPVEFFDKDRLNAVVVPNPSQVAWRYVGVQGVAEPAALVSAGPGATLAVAKRKFANCTVAVARTRC